MSGSNLVPSWNNIFYVWRSHPLPFRWCPGLRKLSLALVWLHRPCRTLLPHLLRGAVLPATHNLSRMCITLSLHPVPFSHISVRIPDDSRKHSENHWSRPWQSSVSRVSQCTHLPSPKNSLSQWLFRKSNSAEPMQICTKIAQEPVC